jgi:NAD(P)H-hydrate repair Nnr-like enzyme with NAD(P)H-hydrate dehydratase domain
VLKKFAAAGIVTAATAGVMLFGSPANADINTGGTGDVLSGTQIIAPVYAPISFCSNTIKAIRAMANTNASCRSGTSVKLHRHHHFHPMGY